METKKIFWLASSLIYLNVSAQDINNVFDSIGQTDSTTKQTTQMKEKNESPKRGDVNGDGQISIQDAIAIVNHIIGKTPEGFIKTAADVTGDGKISILDAVVLIRKVSKGENDGLNVDIDPWDNDGTDNGGVAE